MFIRDTLVVFNPVPREALPVVEDNNIRERMPWLFGGEKWVNMPSGWGHPYECLDPQQRQSIAHQIRSGRKTKAQMMEHWGVSLKTINKVLQDTQ